MKKYKTTIIFAQIENDHSIICSYPLCHILHESSSTSSFEIIFSKFNDIFKSFAGHSLSCPQLVTDGEIAIADAAMKVFNIEKRFRCWFHLVSNLRDKFISLGFKLDLEDRNPNKIKQCFAIMKWSQFLPYSYSFEIISTFRRSFMRTNFISVTNMPLSEVRQKLKSIADYLDTKIFKETSVTQNWIYLFFTETNDFMLRDKSQNKLERHNQEVKKLLKKGARNQNVINAKIRNVMRHKATSSYFFKKAYLEFKTKKTVRKPDKCDNRNLEICKKIFDLWNDGFTPREMYFKIRELENYCES
jgi:hypothetical protein